jgi:hypothetical protein
MWLFTMQYESIPNQSMPPTWPLKTYNASAPNTNQHGQKCIDL